MATLLNYTLLPNPNPLTVGISNGALTLLVDNPNDEDVELEGITMTIETGKEEQDLTNLPKNIDQTLPEGWTKNKPNESPGKYTFVFMPTSGKTFKFPAHESISFEFTNIIIVKKGLANITITEKRKGCSSIQLHVSKFPEGWGTVTFSATPPNIINKGDVSLNWKGPKDASYVIKYLDPESQQPITIPKQGGAALGPIGPYPGPNDPSININRTTTFTLQVKANILGQLYSTEIQKQVTVGEIPTVTSFTGSISGPPGKQVILLIWQCSDNTDHVLVSWNNDIKSPNPSQPEVLDLPFSENEFSIIAVAANDVQSKPSLVEVIMRWENIKDVEVPNLPLVASIFPDNKYALLAQELDIFHLFDIETLSVVREAINLKDINQFVISNDGLKAIGLPGSGNHITLINIPKFTSDRTAGQWGWITETADHITDVVISPDSKTWYGINTSFSEDNMSVLCGSFENFKNPIAYKLDIYQPNLIAVAQNAKNNVNHLLIGTHSGIYFFMDLTNFKIVKQFEDLAGISMKISPDGLWAIVPDGEGNILIIDTKQMKMKKKLTVDMAPGDVVFTSDGSKAIVFETEYGLEPNQIVIIDMSSFEIIKEVSSGHWISEMVITPDDQFALFGDREKNAVKVMDLKDYSVSEHTAKMPSPAYHLNITPDGKYVFVTYLALDKITILQKIWTLL